MVQVIPPNLAKLIEKTSDSVPLMPAFLSDRSEPVCWVLSEGMIGTQNQCLALARACGFSNPVVKKIGLRQPWKSVTPYIRHFCTAALTPESSPLEAPWPDVIIAAGRKAIAPALWVKRQSGGKTLLVIVTSPVIKDKNFDLVVAPRHDAYHAPYAITMTGALSLMNADSLAAAQQDHPYLQSLPQPRVAVMIGGTSRTHTLTTKVAKRLGQQLATLRDQGFGLMMTASRRTPPELAQHLRDTLHGENVYFWDGTGANPYQAFLGYADVILVTEDSATMAAESISTGKPVYIIPLEGGSARFKRFQGDIIERGFARWFDGTIETWSYTPPNDLADAAARVKILLQNK